MLDISAAGCRVAGAVNGADRLPEEGDAITLNLTLPAKPCPSQATGHVQRVVKDDRRWKVGIAFERGGAELVTTLEPYLKLASTG